MRLDAEATENLRGKDGIRRTGIDQSFVLLEPLTRRIADFHFDLKRAHVLILSLRPKAEICGPT